MTLEELQEILATVRAEASAKQREDYGNGMEFACLIIELAAYKLEQKNRKNDN